MLVPPWRLSLVCLAVSVCGQWQFGYQITYVNTAVKTFYGSFEKLYQQDKNCTECEFPDSVWSLLWSVAVASFYPGAIIGFSLVPFMVKKIGVKRALSVSAIPAIAGCIVGLFSQAQATHVPTGKQDVVLFELLVLSRFLCGMHAGAALALLPLFTTECSPLRYQGFLAAFQEVAQALTDLIGFVVGSPQIVSSAYHYELLQLIALLPTVVLVVVLAVIQDTPVHYLVRKQDWEKGEESIRFYYGKNVDTELATLDIMHAHADSNSRSASKYSMRELLCPSSSEGKLVRKALLLGMVAAASYAFTADDLLDSFSATIFEDIQGDAAGSERLAEVVTICLGATLVVTSAFGCVTVEHFGRRPVLIIGLLGTALCNSLVPFCKYLPEKGAMASSIVLFILCKVCIGLGAGAPAWFLTSELVPSGARSIAQSISTGLLLTTSGIVTAVFLQVQNWIGQFSLLVLAGAPAALCAIILLIYLPETKDKHFADIKPELAGRQMFKKSPSQQSLIVNGGEDTGYGSTFSGYGSSAWTSESEI